MATLTGKSIESTYPGLLKTSDESALDPTIEKKVQDGLGNNSTLSMSQGSASFDGILDLSAAAVSGAPIDVDAANANVLAKGANAQGTTNMINVSPTFNSIFQPASDSIGIGFSGASGPNSIFIGKFGTSWDDSSLVGYNSFLSTARSGIFGNGNGIAGQSLANTEDKNFIFGYGNTIPENANISNTHIIGSDITADESNVVMTNKPVKATGFKTAGYGEVIDNSGNWVGQPIGGGGAAGLVNGDGTDSLKSADTLTTLPAQAKTTGSIAIGNNAIVPENLTRPTWQNKGHIAIGNNAQVQEQSFGDFYNASVIAIGDGAIANGSYDGGSIAIGSLARAQQMHGISIGYNTITKQFAIAQGQNATADDFSVSIGRNSSAATSAVSLGPNATSTNESVAIGVRSQNTNTRSVAIGRDTEANTNSVAIGNFTQTKGTRSIAMSCSAVAANVTDAAGAVAIIPGSDGCTIPSTAANSITIGPGIGTRVTAENAIAIGNGTFGNAVNGVALGAGVTSSIANTVSVKELETQTVGGGIIMYSPNGTGYKLTVSDAGAPVFTAI